MLAIRTLSRPSYEQFLTDILWIVVGVTIIGLAYRAIKATRRIVSEQTKKVKNHYATRKMSLAVEAAGAASVAADEQPEHAAEPEAPASDDEPSE